MHPFERLLSVINEVQKDSINPYYEKRKRGRPSKLQIEKRKKAQEWQNEYNNKNGFNKKLGFIDALLK